MPPAGNFIESRWEQCCTLFLVEPSSGHQTDKHRVRLSVLAGALLALVILQFWIVQDEKRGYTNANHEDPKEFAKIMAFNAWFMFGPVFATVGGMIGYYTSLAVTKRQTARQEIIAALKAEEGDH